MGMDYSYQKPAPYCDVCQTELGRFDTFEEAVRAKKEAGWISRKINGEWNDICPSCLQYENLPQTQK